MNEHRANPCFDTTVANVGFNITGDVIRATTTGAEGKGLLIDHNTAKFLK